MDKPAAVTFSDETLKRFTLRFLFPNISDADNFNEWKFAKIFFDRGKAYEEISSDEDKVTHEKLMTDMENANLMYRSKNTELSIDMNLTILYKVLKVLNKAKLQEFENLFVMAGLNICE